MMKQFGVRVFSESVPRLWNVRPQILMRVFVFLLEMIRKTLL